MYGLNSLYEIVSGIPKSRVVRKIGYIGIGAVASLIIASCGGSSTESNPTATPNPNNNRPVATATFTPTSTPQRLSTSTPEPTEEPNIPTPESPLEIIVDPTETPVPPTEVPAPTATLVPPTEIPIPTVTSIPPTVTPVPATPTPIPNLNKIYQERLVNAGYPSDTIKIITSLPYNENSKGFIDELLFMSKEGYDTQSIVKLVQPILGNGITDSELSSVRDFDKDRMSNRFEINYNGTDPFTPNQKYAIVMNTWEDGEKHNVNEDAQARAIKEFLIDNYDWIPGNITVIQYKDATYDNFRKAIEDVAQKVTKNDDVYIIWGAHGSIDNMGFQCGWLASSQYNSCDIKSYENIDRLIDQIEPRVLTLIHSASFSWTMLDYFEEGPSPRIISTSGPIRNKLPNGEWDIPYTFGGNRAFVASMNVVKYGQQLSLQEFLQLGAPVIGTPDFDPYNLSNGLYLGEAKPLSLPK